MLVLLFLFPIRDKDDQVGTIIGDAVSMTPVPTERTPTPEPLEPTPVPIPTPTPQVYHGLEALVAEFFPEAPDTWIAIFRCESVNFREDVVYGPHISRSGDRGLPQINELHAWRYMDRGWEYYTAERDPLKDLTIAREIADERGTQPWSCAHILGLG